MYQKAISQNMEWRYLNKRLHGIAHKNKRNIFNVRDYIIDTVIELAENGDETTAGHTGRTVQILGLLINGMIKRNLYADELRTADVELLSEAAQLHDVGKISIHDKILLKPDKLTSEEFELMKMHVDFGVMLIDKFQKKTPDNGFWDYARVMIETHHEKWNGTGYPNRLAGDKIPLYGRLMAITDVYDALTTKRPYKKALSVDEALATISKSGGTHFDPVIAKAFPEIVKAGG